MTLGEFLEKFSSNNLIRLHYICDVSGGYKTVLEEFNKVSMDWEVNKNKGPYAIYKDNKVIKLVSILCDGHYPEAINIVIEEIPTDIMRNNKLEKFGL